MFLSWIIAYVLARRPRRNKDTEKLEHIQRKGTKLNTEQGDLNSESPVIECGLNSLDTSILRGEQTGVDKF